MYYSGSDIDGYSRAMIVYFAVFVVAVVLLVAAVILYFVVRSKKGSKRGSMFVTLLLVAATLTGIAGFLNPKPTCCGQGYSLNPQTSILLIA